MKSLQCVFSEKLSNRMFRPQLSKALKDLPNRVLNVSVEERTELFHDVTNVLTNPGWITSPSRQHHQNFLTH